MRGKHGRETRRRISINHPFPFPLSHPGPANLSLSFDFLPSAPAFPSTIRAAQPRARRKTVSDPRARRLHPIGHIDIHPCSRSLPRSTLTPSGPLVKWKVGRGICEREGMLGQCQAHRVHRQ